jgi:hypothetical protein
MRHSNEVVHLDRHFFVLYFEITRYLTSPFHWRQLFIAKFLDYLRKLNLKVVEGNGYGVVSRQYFMFFLAD